MNTFEREDGFVECQEHFIRWMGGEYDGCPLCALEAETAALKAQLAADAPYTRLGRTVSNMPRYTRLEHESGNTPEQTWRMCFDNGNWKYEVRGYGSTAQAALDAAGVRE